MSGKRAKAIRRAGVDTGPGPNVTDLIDTREDRRDKRFRKQKIDAQMRDTDPIAHRERAAFWTGVRLWLTMPAYREGLEDPHKPRQKEL